MDQHVLFGLVCCVLLIVVFLTWGRKTDMVSWLALIMAIVVILVVCTHWDTIVQWWPATAAHAAPVATPAHVPPASQGISVKSISQSTAMPGMRHPSAAPHTSLVSLLIAPGDGLAITFLMSIACTIASIAFVRAKRRSRSWRS